MAADFWAGYISGAAGIVIGNPLDIIKVRLQSGTYLTTRHDSAARRSFTSWIRGATAPILTYGALNAILYSTYNRCLNVLDPATTGQTDFPQTTFWQLWTAGAVGGLATWLVSAPTELIKCQAQLQDGKSSWSVAKEVWRSRGLRGLYHGGAITSIRDAVGYGFYFWSYELGKRSLGYVEGEDGAAVKVLVAGGIAGVVTWTSIYPLDVIKTRVQGPASTITRGESAPLVGTSLVGTSKQGTWSIVKSAYQQDGGRVFFQGLGVCNVRAFIVNAVQVSAQGSTVALLMLQWLVYERVMTMMKFHGQTTSTLSHER